MDDGDEVREIFESIRINVPLQRQFKKRVIKKFDDFHEKYNKILGIEKSSSITSEQLMNILIVVAVAILLLQLFVYLRFYAESHFIKLRKFASIVLTKAEEFWHLMLRKIIKSEINQYELDVMNKFTSIDEKITELQNFIETQFKDVQNQYNVLEYYVEEIYQKQNY